MANYRQVPVEQVKTELATSKEKPTSDQLRLQAQKLRDTATRLMEHATVLVERSIELEKQVCRHDSKQAKKPS